MNNTNDNLLYFPETHNNLVKQTWQIGQYWRVIIAICRLIQNEKLREDIKFTHHSSHGIDSTTFDVRGNYYRAAQHQEFHLRAIRSEKGLKTYYTAENNNGIQTEKDNNFSAGPAILAFNVMKYIYLNRTK